MSPDFLTQAGVEAGDLESQLSEIVEASARLARHFCEDEAKFQLNEGMALFADFLSKTQLACKVRKGGCNLHVSSIPFCVYFTRGRIQFSTTT